MAASLTKQTTRVKLGLMKKIKHLAVSTLIVSVFFSVPAFAKEKAKSQPVRAKEEASESVMTSDSGSSRSKMRFGAGFSTTQHFVAVSTAPALSALDHPRYDVWVLRCDVPDLALPEVEDAPEDTVPSEDSAPDAGDATEDGNG